MPNESDSLNDGGAADADFAARCLFIDPATRRVFIKQMAGTGVGLAFGAQAFSANAVDALSSEETAHPIASEMVDVHLTINGNEVSMRLDARVTLLDAVRNDLALTGSKKGCDHGQCGACTMLVNGRRINSCLSLAVMHDGDAITTIEGIADGETLHPVQAAFIQHDGFQCGYCTPGQICSAVALLKEGHAKSDAEIREWMSGNICRCGAYTNIVAAIREARDKMTTPA